MSFNRLLLIVLAGAAVFAMGFILGSVRSRWRDEGWGATMRRLVKPTLLLSGALLIGIQLIPYGRDHTNPPVVAEPPWDSPETRELAVRACFDCHSNETVWPWYSNIAPISWLVQRDVLGGRSDANWSEWGIGEDESEESAETVREGSMPLTAYTWLHSEARLSEEELGVLAQGLAATFGSGDDE